MTQKNKNLVENKAVKTFLFFNKLETGEENKEFAERIGISEGVLYSIASGRTKKPHKLVARAIVDGSNGKLTMKDLGYSE